MMNPSEDNPVCQKCGLYKTCRTPFMSPTGSNNAKLLVIGEAPGEDEDKQGKPFVGKSGSLLREALDGCGLDIDDEVRFTNIVRCRPPDNKISKIHINYCKAFAMDELLDSNAEYVFLMGNSPLNGILGESGISNWNGIVIDKEYVIDEILEEKKQFKIVPLYHPAYILRDISKMDEWLDAMVEALNGKSKYKGTYERLYPKTVEEVRDMYNYLKDYQYISYDCETSSLKAFNNDSLLLAVSFAAGNRAYAVAMDHPESTWDDDSYGIVADIIIAILHEHSGYIIGHNLKFDLMHTYAQLNAWFSPGGDTMLINHLLDSVPGRHGLKKLAGQYIGMYEYEQELTDYIRKHPECDPRKGGSYAFIPLDVLLPYSAMDAEATIKLNDVLYPKLSDKQKILYEELVMGVSDSLAKMQCNGFALDTFIAKRYECIYKKVQEKIYKQLLEDNKVKKLVSNKQKEMLLTYYDNDFGDYIYKNKPVDKKFLLDKCKFRFNPNSSFHVSELFFDYYNIPVLAKTEKDKPSVSAKIYKSLEPDYPIIRQIRYYKMMTKMLGTYLTPSIAEWICDDGYVRTSYNQHGTVTGRLSSSDPVNLQNIPTPEKEPGTLLESLPIKNLFRTRYMTPDRKFYGKLVSLDYSGMELRIFSSLAKCYTMIDIHKSGLDFHRVVAALSMRLISEKDIRDVASDRTLVPAMEEILATIEKSVRYRYKWTNWTLLYGGDAHTLSNMYSIPIKEAEETVEMYYDIFPEVLDYKYATISFAEKHGYVESPYGRREYLPYINDRINIAQRNTSRRAAINMPSQSGASDTVMCALYILDCKLSELGMKPLLVNTVHDSIVGDCLDEDIESFANLAVDCMENVVKYSAEYLPRLDMSWLICPLKADVDVGTHYGSEIPLDKYLKQV